jgi:hypothetical protein
MSSHTAAAVVFLAAPYVLTMALVDPLWEVFDSHDQYHPLLANPLRWLAPMAMVGATVFWLRVGAGSRRRGALLSSVGLSWRHGPPGGRSVSAWRRSLVCWRSCSSRGIP